MLKVGAALLVLLVLASSCGGGETTKATIETEGGEVTIDVEIADEPGERRRGLSGRTSLPEGAGMLFLYAEDSRGGYWMKDTLIPLSIAYLDAEGRILAVLDMEPCQADPCPAYDPGLAYRGALEVNQGAFDRWGVREGDVVRVE
jgi:uncharacterized protein